MEEDIITHGLKAKAQPEIKKGDFVRSKETGFVGIVEDNQVKRKTRLVHAFGMAEETGDMYASDLEKIDEKEFEAEKSRLFKAYNVPYYQQWSKAEMDKQAHKIFESSKKKKLGEMV